MQLTTAFLILGLMVAMLIGVQFFHILARLALLAQATSAWICEIPSLIWQHRSRWHQHYAAARTQLIQAPAGRPPLTGIQKHWQTQATLKLHKSA